MSDKISYKVTVVTVVFNDAAHIESTMLSVIGQTYKNIEYIVIDGKSNDGTTDLIKRYSDKITKWISEPDKGIYDAMNKGLALATGDYVIFMNSGDKFIDKMASVEEIKTHFPEALAVDMESAAIAHVCNKMHVPMFCMRVISDSPGASHNNSRQYEDFWSAAPEQTFEIVRQLLEKLK